MKWDNNCCFGWKFNWKEKKVKNSINVIYVFYKILYIIKCQNGANFSYKVLEKIRRNEAEAKSMGVQKSNNPTDSTEFGRVRDQTDGSVVHRDRQSGGGF